MAGFDVGDCDKVAEGRRHVDRRHGTTSCAFRGDRSILIHMCCGSHVIKLHVWFKITVYYDAQTRDP